ncbi:hypothetical protein N0V88_003837 [Collariella sp. IMI 366227]|nr:hypothetical protein N0V88_003837 [Collariella sp. IMI 366227]
MTTLQRLDYTSLDRDQKQIRLLNLKPGARNDAIKLELETTTLDNPEPYTCLSYAWGPPDPHRSVVVNGCIFNVRENLYLALRRLRLRGNARRLWVDAICINQDDNAEREAQVGIMQHIFDSAADVIAWIGEDNGAADKRAIAFIGELAARSLALIETQSRQNDIKASAIREKLADWLETVTPFGLVDSIWLDFSSLINRPWFSRIWIIQEVVMGRGATVQCGRHQFSWMDLFYGAVLIIDYAELIASFAAPDCLQYHDPAMSRFYMEQKPLRHLLQAVHSIRSIGYLVSQRRLHQKVLTALRMAKRITNEEANRRLQEVLDRLPEKVGEVYQRFVGTLMASGSDEGTKKLLDPPPNAKPTLYMYKREKPGHFSHPWEINAEGRESMLGDSLVLFLGSDVLHVIRQVEVAEGEPTVFRLVGEAYVHHWMNGELIEGMRLSGQLDMLQASIIRLK